MAMGDRHVYHVTPTEEGEWYVQKELMRFADRQDAIDFARLLAKLESSGLLKVHRRSCPLQLEYTHAETETS
jgi:hypothetical protein